MSEETEIILSYTVKDDNEAIAKGYSLVSASEDKDGRDVRVFYKGELGVGISMEVLNEMAADLSKIRKILEGKHTDKASVDKVLKEFMEGDGGGKENS